VSLWIAGDADRPWTVRVLGHDWEQLDGRCIQAVWRVGVAADQEQVVHTSLRHAGEECVEVGTIPHHAGSQVHGYRMSKGTKTPSDLDGAVRPVLR
jgi:hypothetical protein